MSDITKVLSIMGFSKQEQQSVTSVVGTLRRVLSMKRKALEENGNISPTAIKELMLFKDWYIEWKEITKTKPEAIEEAFTETIWENYLLEISIDEKLKLQKEEIKTPKEAQESKSSPTTEGLNVSYKVETKDIPKLPAGKALKGKIFDDWHTTFHTKMCQARIEDIMEPGYTPPKPKENGYQSFRTKDAYLKNHLLSATIGSNAISFLNANRLGGLEMYRELLGIYQGTEYKEDKAINAVLTFEKLHFDRNTKHSPEKFLAQINECLKRMEVTDAEGKIEKPVSDLLLPSLFRAKVDHPSNDQWKALSEANRDDWKTVQMTFLREAERKFGATHDKSDRFRSANQQVLDNNRNSLTVEERKTYQKCCNKGTNVPPRIWNKLTKPEKDLLIKAKRNKKRSTSGRNDGGLGTQYSVNHQSTQLSP